MTSKQTDVRTVQETPLVPQSTDHNVMPAPGDRRARIRPRPCANPSGRLRKTENKAREPRLFSMLTDDQIRVAELIARGFHLRTAGLGMRTQTYCWQPPGTGNTEDWLFDVMRRFTRWAVAVQEAGLSLAAVLDVIVFGQSCRAVDRARRKRNGYARAQILDALELYGKI
ncbi:hypothetical protein [Sneathiella sp.]|uniref:hypothetical protein n=1 Tax=Sneathiella sp. TaxID=1964365 RepID=UPI0026360AD6|nr:hypothetical protein [Sneathiella sp.]MDF2367487.1 hypothetical protein [Sneathiella sp.]